MVLELQAAAEAAALLEERRLERDLFAFIPAVTPGYAAPRHLHPYVETLARTWTHPVRAVLSTPPRHAKSETTLHAIVQTLRRDPRKRIGYATYAAEFSAQQSKHAALIAHRAGVSLLEQRHDFWRTAEGGQVIWTSIGGPLTGKGVDLMIVDDPVKDRQEAESPTYRERAWSWFNAIAFTRLEPGGSVVVIQTRWHPDDLAGRLISQGWPRINLPAIDDDGAALWSERYPVESLRKIQAQVGEYDWTSLYQGEPRSKGGRVFKDPTYYVKPPTLAYRIRVGVDLAYTAKTHSDYSAAVVMAEYDGKYYILDVLRMQVEAPAFAEQLAKVVRRHPGAQAVAHVATVEKGTIDLIKKTQRINIRDELARGDKFVRAQPVAAAWNAGKVMIPSSGDWVEAFVNEVTNFTGLDDPHDDMVDALSSAYFDFAGPSRVKIDLT